MLPLEAKRKAAESPHSHSIPVTCLPGLAGSRRPWPFCPPRAVRACVHTCVRVFLGNCLTYMHAFNWSWPMVGLSAFEKHPCSRSPCDGILTCPHTNPREAHLTSLPTPLTRSGRVAIFHIYYPRAAIWERNRIHFLATIFHHWQTVTIAYGTLEKLWSVN